MALEQIELLKSEGVDLSFEPGAYGSQSRPVLSRADRRNGAFMSFDGIGKIKYAPESTRISLILELVRKGFEDQILISGDTARKTYYKHYDQGLGLGTLFQMGTALCGRGEPKRL